MRCRTILHLLAILVLALPSALAAQTRTIAGRVMDATTRQPIVSANITVVGGPQTAQANSAGEFRLTVPATDVIVRVRAFGYRRQEIAVAATQSDLQVGMVREAVKLSEVVVTGAATTQERRNVSTAVATISTDEVNRVPAASLDAALQGKIVGASINMNSGAPGGGGQIQIRGVTSILGNGEPLYVVDGVIISNAAFSSGINAVSRASGAATAITTNQDNQINRLADINPNDIESMQVLKSAAATAIYGSKATNGVILITTKRGRSGETRYTWSQRVGAYRPDRLLGSRHFTKQTATQVLGATNANKYCPTTCAYYDYQSALYGQKDLSYETNMTVSGGANTARYFASGLVKDERGTEMNTGSKHQSLRFNLDNAWGDRWTASASGSIMRSLTDRGLSNNDNTFISPIYAFGYTPAIIDLQAQNAGRYVDNTLIRDLYGTGTNPFQTLQFLKNREDVWRQIGAGVVRFSAYASPRQTLTLSASGGFDRFDNDGEVYSPNFLQYEPDDGLAGTAVQSEALSRQFNGTLSGVHTYVFPGTGLLANLTSATTSAGAQYEDRSLNRYNIQARGLVPTIDLIDQGTPTLVHVRQAVRDQAYFVSEELLALNERLSVAGRVRAERGSANGDRDKYFVWPAVSGSYRFVTPFPYADEIKLRAAVGNSGNQPNYGNRDITIAGLGLIDGRTALGVPASIGNPNIEPEKMREIEYGVDALFWESRAGLEASVFNRTIHDLLLTSPLAPTSGFTQQFINGGKMETKGFEAAVSIAPVRTPTMTWNSRVQYFTNKSRIRELPTKVADFVVASSGFGAQYGRGRIARGQVTTMIWGNRYRCDVDARSAGKCATLDSSVVDTVLADANPKFQMQFSNDFTWKNFSLVALLDWRKGGFVSDMTNNLFDEGSNSWDYDHPSPDPTLITAKRVANGESPSLGQYRYDKWNAGRNAGVYVHDGSYLKLREVTLAYQVPTPTAYRLARARDLRVVVSGRNLMTKSNYWSFDPEVNNFGNQNVVRFVDLAPYPPTRSFFLGFDVGF